MIGSRPVVGVSVREQVGERAAVPVLCTVAAAAIGVATWRLIDRDPEVAGWAALAAGGCLVVAGAVLRAEDRRARVVLSFADRAFDGCILAALAWATRSTDASVAAAAIVALAAGYLASYIRAKGGSLGYGIEEGVITPVVRYALFALALLLDWMAWAIWVVAAVNLLAAAVRSSRVARQERR